MNDRERISAVDSAWLRMERPHNLMMITSVFVFENRIAFKDVIDLVENRFLCYARFKQKAVNDDGTAFWETDTDFDIRRHVHRTALPGSADKTELEELLSDLISTPLNFSMPLWQFHLIEKYQNGSALIFRIHHSYADGSALMGILSSMTKTESKAPPSTEDHRYSSMVSSSQRVIGLADTVLNLSTAFWAEMMRLLQHPTHTVDYLNRGWDVTAEIVKIASMSDDPKTCLKGKLGVNNRIAWSSPLPLDEIKAIATVLGTSVNNVLLSCVAGALGNHLQQQGDDFDEIKIRAVIPVNLKSLDSANELGNRFGIVFVSLPIGVANPLQRLMQVSRSMEELKQSYQAVIAYVLLTALGLGSKNIQDFIIDMLTNKASTIVTNVAGPQLPLFMAGSRVDEIIFWVPQAGQIGIGVSLISYNGRVQIGVMTDSKLVSDPRPIVDNIAAEFEKLLLSIFLRVPEC